VVVVARSRLVRNRRGLSLVEVLVAFTMLGMALMSLVPLFLFGMQVNASSRDLSVANSMAREKLDQLLQYPSTDARLQIPQGATLADASNNSWCSNDLPTWHKPATGETVSQAASPGAGWFRYPCTRTYTIQAYSSDLTAAPVSCPVADESAYVAGTATPYYTYKLVTVTVTPNDGHLPGLRMTRQSAYLRYRNAR